MPTLATFQSSEYLGDLLVAVLVRAVERVHRAVAVVHRAVGRDRARVGDARDPETPRGLEHVDRADDVHFGPGDGVGLAEGDLQGRQMDHRARTHRFENVDDGLALRDVAGAPRDLLQVALGDQEARSPFVLRQVERARRNAGAHEQREDPASDAAARAGDEDGAGEARAID